MNLQIKTVKERLPHIFDATINEYLAAGWDLKTYETKATDNEVFLLAFLTRYI